MLPKYTLQENLFPPTFLQQQKRIRIDKYEAFNLKFNKINGRLTNLTSME